MSSLLALALKQIRIFSGLLSFLDWNSLHAILDSSKQARLLFNDPALRDLVLSRFIPAYEACRRSAAILHTPVPIDIYNLHLFLISQNFPLHLYPTYALRKLSTASLFDRDTALLISLAQAHSRVILLLQSLVHSSPDYTIPPEPSHSFLFESAFPPLPELTTPAPLSYKTDSPNSSPTPSIISRPDTPSTRSSKFTLRSASARPLSMFNPRTAPLPAPSQEPPAFTAYSYSWRRSRSHRHSTGSEFYSHSDSDNDFAPPRRLYAPSSFSKHSSLSPSVSPSPTPTRRGSTSRRNSTYLYSYTGTISSSPSPPPAISPARFLTSPHDLVHATSRVRAPVLRVYIPTAAPFGDQQTIVRCEEQLVKVGLWNYLSIGDIVVNLGHVPLSDDDDEGKPLPPPPLTTSAADRRRSLPLPMRQQSLTVPSDNWLIFNGTFLVPFTSSPIQVPDALTLPSPFYYTHILPRLANPVFLLRNMPKFTIAPSPPPPRSANPYSYRHYYLNSTYTRPEAHEIPMRLVSLPTRVGTTYANGMAVVRRYKWLARVFVIPFGPGDEQELGVGWSQGEWILEGDGTKEGKEVLLDWLVGRGDRAKAGSRREAYERLFGEEEEEEWKWEWELVRERCRKRRLWLRLLNVRKPSYEENGRSRNVKMDLL